MVKPLLKMLSKPSTSLIHRRIKHHYCSKICFIFSLKKNKRKRNAKNSSPFDNIAVETYFGL